MANSSIQDNVIKKVLPNGLTVLLKEDRSNPVVAVNVWFGVGSVNETDNMTGLAHFQEHMVFKGTKRHGVGEIANIVKSAGGNLNAATSYSYTMYYVVLPSRSFSLGLDVQADAMMNSTFDAEEFQKERLVVIDEARMYDDTPDSYTFYRTMELGFKTHNYRRPIAGYEKVVEKFTRDQLLEFYNRYYRPGNAVLTVVGDVDPETALRNIEKVYGGWKNGKVDVNESPVEPPQTGFRFKATRGSIDHAYFSFGFHVPSILDDDYPALEMLATLLGSGKSSRLHKKILEDKHLATTVSADLLAEKWPGYFMVFASTPSGKWVEARNAIFEELIRFQHEPISEDELVKARRQLEKSTYGELETVEGQASTMGYYEVVGDYRLAAKHREAIRKVTPEEVMNVANKYFTPENCSVVSYLPEDKAVKEPETAEVEAALRHILKSFAASPPKDKSRSRQSTGNGAAPKGVPAAKSTAGPPPKMKLTTLDNGLRILVKQRTTVPIVSMLTVFQGGTRLEPPGKAGLATLGTRVLLKGTKTYTAEQVVDTIEGLGGSIESFSSFDVTGVYTSVLSEYLDDAVRVYKDILRKPQFSPDKIEKEKSKLLKELAKRHDHPVYYSIDQLFTNMFGDHPYGHPFIGSESELAGLTKKDCAQWYKDILTPENMVLVFVGDITDEKAAEVAKHLLGDLSGGPVKATEAKAPTIPVTPGMHELTRNNLKQAVALVGFIAPPMMTREAISLGVLNGIMTGLGGRLFVELRDKRSLGYMAGSSFLPLKDGSMFYGYSNPGAQGVDEAIEVILNELAKVSKEPVREDELRRSKEWLIGSQTMKLQRNLAQATEYGIYEALGFGFDTVDRTPEIIQDITKQDILRAAAKVFDRDQAVFIKLIPEMQKEPTTE